MIEAESATDVVGDGRSTSIAKTSSPDSPKPVKAEATTRETLQAGLARLEGGFIERAENTECRIFRRGKQ